MGLEARQKRGEVAHLLEADHVLWTERLSFRRGKEQGMHAGGGGRGDAGWAVFDGGGQLAATISGGQGGDGFLELWNKIEVGLVAERLAIDQGSVEIEYRHERYAGR